MSRIALHWFRRDLRLLDNAALYHALKEYDAVYPFFVFDDKILTAPDIGAPRVHFLLNCLDSLQKNCAVQGGNLVIRRGPVVSEIEKLIHETGASAVFWNRDYEPYARERDATVEKALTARGVAAKHFADGVIHEPHEVLKADRTPYAVFTPYSRVWRSLPKPPPLPLAKFKPVPKAVPSDPLPTGQHLGFPLSIELPPAGERAGLDRMKFFMTSAAARYGTQRNFPNIDGTSQLSPHLRFGTLSPRTIFTAAEKLKSSQPEAKAEIDVFITELIWREFYRQILWHYPHVATRAFKPQYDSLKWENNETYFQAWCEGRTGYPIVDAAMRQLNQTGWMHNRLRMIVAMFLTKDLLIDWKWGERYFMQKLVDGDLAANNGGWQWSSSTGTDAQPYFRIFNPNSQAEKFDPEGRFIERYVPEANLIGKYPRPIVDHGTQRLKALALFKVLKN
jgi:deoxyribodipyrimidine photo-lyase